MHSWRSRAALLAAALLLAGAGAAASYRGFSPRFPPPQEIRVPADGAAGDMFSLALGARRLFADLWFVRLMQYYGTPELEPGETPADHEREAAEAALGGHHHHEENFGAGNYPLFLAMAMHVLELDPYFTSAGLYGAGSLAFNMNRPEEAKRLLAYGLRYCPREWKYLNLLAAIGYSGNGGDPAAVAAQLRPILKDPDCPVMLKQLAAFLNKKAGNFREAYSIYSDIAATSRDPAYVANARRELERLSGRSGR